MVGRWAGIRGPGRKNRNPQESVLTRGDQQQVSDRVHVYIDKEMCPVVL